MILSTGTVGIMILSIIHGTTRHGHMDGIMDGDIAGILPTTAGDGVIILPTATGTALITVITDGGIPITITGMDTADIAMLILKTTGMEEEVRRAPMFITEQEVKAEELQLLH